MKKKVPSKRRTMQTAFQADCIAALRASDSTYKLAVADPPYNQGMNYDAYDDNKKPDEYMHWTREWITAVIDRLDRHGSLWIFCPDEWVSEIDILVRKEFHFTKRRHVVWAFTFGQAAQNNFSRSHAHILYFTRTKTRFTFNADVLRVPSARQLVYGDKRAQTKGKMPDATWMLLREQLEPCMTPDRDTWLVSRICGTYKERQKHSPNQIPVPIMERIVLACSNPGDWVLDPFAGSGSSGVACALHDRNWDGYDVSKTCVQQSQKRINASKSEA